MQFVGVTLENIVVAPSLLMFVCLYQLRRRHDFGTYRITS